MTVEFKRTASRLHDDEIVGGSSPDDARTRKTRAKIVDAARAVFSECGYEGASIDAIAARVPMSKRTLYNHFVSKEILFQAVISNSWSWLLSSSSVDLENAAPKTLDDARICLRNYGDAVLTHWNSPGVIELIRLVISEAHRFPEISEAYLKRGKMPAVTRLTKFLIRVRDAGIAEVSEPSVAAWQFHGMLKETAFLPVAIGLKPLFKNSVIVEAAVDSTLRRPAYDVAGTGSGGRGRRRK